MARITLIKEGILPKIEGYVIYPLDGQLIIRAQSGFTKKGLKNNPKYATCKKNASEFGRVSSIGKHIRLALQDFLPRQNNLAVVNALTKKLRAVLDCDTVSVRGERSLGCAFTTTEAVAMMMGYAFNPDGVTFLSHKIMPQKVVLTFGDRLVPTSVDFIAIRLVHFVFDFHTMAYQISPGSMHFFALPLKEKTIVLPKNTSADFEGTSFLLVEMVFYKKIEDSFIALPEDGKNQLIIL